MNPTHQPNKQTRKQQYNQYFPPANSQLYNQPYNPLNSQSVNQSTNQSINQMSNQSNNQTNNQQYFAPELGYGPLFRQDSLSDLFQDPSHPSHHFNHAEVPSVSQSINQTISHGQDGVVDQYMQYSTIHQSAHHLIGQQPTYQGQTEFVSPYGNFSFVSDPIGNHPGNPLANQSISQAISPLHQSPGLYSMSHSRSINPQSGQPTLPVQHVPAIFSSMDSRLYHPHEAMSQATNQSINQSSHVMFQPHSEVAILPEGRSSDHTTTQTNKQSVNQYQPIGQTIIQSINPTNDQLIDPSFQRPTDRPALGRNMQGSQSVPLIDRTIRPPDVNPVMQRTHSVEVPPNVPKRNNHKRARGQSEDGSFIQIINQSNSQTNNQSFKPPLTQLSPAAFEGLNKDEVKKLKHRSIDAFRRAREAAAVARLSTWLDSFEFANDTTRSSPPIPTTREKLAVLESSGAHLETLLSRAQQLERQTKELEDQNAMLKLQAHQKVGWVEQSNNQSNNQSDVKPPVNPMILMQIHNQTAIYQSVFRSSNQMLMVLNIDTGRCLDVNPKFVSLLNQSINRSIDQSAIGLTHDNLTQGRYSWPFADLLAVDQSNNADGPIVDTTAQRYQKSQSINQTINQTNNRLHKIGLQHHSRNVQLLMSLFKGDENQVECEFHIKSDNLSKTVKCDCWLGKPDEHFDVKRETESSSSPAKNPAERSSSQLDDIIANPFLYQLVICISESNWLQSIDSGDQDV